MRYISSLRLKHVSTHTIRSSQLSRETIINHDLKTFLQPSVILGPCFKVLKMIGTQIYKGIIF